ncbi:hypothetical protein JT27_18635 [Alcaligenes faecalis]|uniref:hypothetical protein n=1 Tax=Alcaligenes faecalis TaxID=511 RepID=UPI00052CD749|nr:hypothetical protein [Alcaligenes faecalis]KGP00343.1 hypothetical protein JT27_18635 [Alcaligenes faecalis]
MQATTAHQQANPAPTVLVWGAGCADLSRYGREKVMDNVAHYNDRMCIHGFPALGGRYRVDCQEIPQAVAKRHPTAIIPSFQRDFSCRHFSVLVKHEATGETVLDILLSLNPRSRGRCEHGLYHAPKNDYRAILPDAVAFRVPEGVGRIVKDWEAHRHVLYHEVGNGVNPFTDVAFDYLGKPGPDDPMGPEYTFRKIWADKPGHMGKVSVVRGGMQLGYILVWWNVPGIKGGGSTLQRVSLAPVSPQSRSMKGTI